MYDLEDLYQEIVMDHNRRPRNFKKLENAQRTAEGFNPLCGDQISLYLNVDDDGVIEDIGFEGAGCAISKATASMMTEAIKGKNVDKAEEIFEAFRHMLTRKPEEEYDYELLGDLEILQGVSQFPTRIKCATLSWHTLNSALDGKQPSGQKTSTKYRRGRGHAHSGKSGLWCPGAGGPRPARRRPTDPGQRYRP